MALEPSRRFTGPRVYLQLLQREHSSGLLAYRRRNFEFLRPYEPAQDQRELALPEQEALIASWSERAARDQGYHFGIFVLHGGELVGRLNLNNVVRGVFQNAYLGYAMDEAHNGQGLMTEAVAIGCEVAFRTLHLHRLQAATLPWNRASQRVLEKNDFHREGYAPGYLKIAGHWQDHVIFARRVDQLPGEDNPEQAAHAVTRTSAFLSEKR